MMRSLVAAAVAAALDLPWQVSTLE